MFLKLLPGQKVGENRPLLRGYSISLAEKLLLDILLNKPENESKKRHAENHHGLVFLQAVAERRHVVVAHPSVVADVVRGYDLLIGLACHCRFVAVAVFSVILLFVG